MAVYVEAHNIISSLGSTSQENYRQVIEGNSGIQLVADSSLSPIPVQLSLIDSQFIENSFSAFDNTKSYTRFEKIAILSAKSALEKSAIDPTSKKTVFILSTTKGNIELIEQNSCFDKDRIHLWNAANIIAKALGITTSPVVISNACISGVSSMLYAKRVIEEKLYDNAIVVGADVITKFVVSGFQSFLALSQDKCKPFDAQRNGLNLGEAAATIILSKNKPGNGCVEFFSGSSNNDANHISGPSRTGEGLYRAIKNTLNTDQKVGLISAHATATPFNDNMESIALHRSGLTDTPVIGLKGNFAHTLGAAGVLETIITILAMDNNLIPQTLGFSEYGVSEKIYVSAKNSSAQIDAVLKLASGFGGCNAAALFIKNS